MAMQEGPAQVPDDVGESNPWAVPPPSTWMKPMTLPVAAASDNDHDSDGIFFLLPDLDLDLDLPFKHTHRDALDIDLSLPPLSNPPNLDPFTVGPLQLLDELPDGSSVSSHSSHGDEHTIPQASSKTPEQDIWSIACDLGPLENESGLLSWELFADPLHVEPRPAFISEAGPAAFDAALVLQARESRGLLSPGSVLQSDTFFKSLWLLALGRSSLLFPYDDASNTFSQAIDDCRISGCSLDSSQSLVEDVLFFSNGTAALRQFIHNTYAALAPLPSTVALANAVSVTLHAVEQHLALRDAKPTTLLQLQDLIQLPSQLIQTLKDLVDRAYVSNTNAEVVSICFNKLQSAEDSGQDTEFLFHVFDRVSQPWLDLTMEQTGFCVASPLTSSVDDGDSQDINTDKPDSQTSTSFVSQDTIHTIKDTQRCLKYIRDFLPSHPLLNLDASGIKSPRLEWALELSDLDRITRRAEEYRQSLASAVAEFGPSGQHFNNIPSTQPSNMCSATNYVGWPWLEDDITLDSSILNLSTYPDPLTSRPPDQLYSLVARQLSTRSDVTSVSVRPPISSIVNLSLDPLLTAQHAMITATTLRSILHDHGLHQHLHLLHSFHLCSSGIFASHLTTVLFSSDVEAAERTKGVLRTGAGIMGLRLGSGQRREWPPASSEVTLALMNVLSMSWRTQAGTPADNLRLSTTSNSTLQGLSIFNDSDDRAVSLPGGLSFAIRNDVDQDEIERILDAQSIYALDFLKLSYTPPPALAAIFTQPSLNKYDRIFKLLLRLLRMQFVVGQLCRDVMLSSRKDKRSRSRGAPAREVQDANADADRRAELVTHTFRHRATHFVTNLCAHFLNTGIARPWRQLQEYIAALVVHVSPAAPHHQRTALPAREFSLAGLAHMHEATLETVSTALLLRNRQLKLAAALELVLGDILAFAAFLRDERPSSQGVVALYAMFDAHLAEFKGVLTKACDKSELSAGTRGGDGSGGSETLRELLERL